MKRLLKNNINTPDYWDKSQTATDFGLRQEKYRELVGSGYSIVELGCGLSPFLSGVDFIEKVAVDFSPATLMEYAVRFPDVDAVQADVCETGLDDEEFDAVVAGEVIEHLEDPMALLDEMERICKPGGIMVLSTPHLEFDDPEHLWEFDKEDFKGWETEEVKSERFQGRSYLFIWKRKEHL